MSMMIKMLILLFITFSLMANAREIARGKVFNDLNRNSAWDKNEPGIPNVLVSNGNEVVKTDMKGNYSISIQAGMVLFVIKPSGFSVPLSSLNLPQFYYIHKPNGSPDFEYAGSAPTGKLPKEINFPLYPQTEPDNFELFIFGDPQPRNGTEIDYLAHRVFSEIAGDTLRKFGISMGDIMFDQLNHYGALNQAVATIGLPWYNVVGNHDLNFDAPNDSLSQETFESVYGPSTYVFQYGSAHFFILDDVIYKPDTALKYVGGFRPGQLGFIENYLSFVPGDELLVFCLHIPIFHEHAPYSRGFETFRSADRKAFFKLLADRPHTVSMAAHTHIHHHHFFGEDNDWLQPTPHHHYNAGAICGDWQKGLLRYDGTPDATMRDGTPLGYTIMKVKGNQYQLRYKVAGAPETKQISVSQVSDSTAILMQYYLFANFYLGHSQSKVTINFNNNGLMDMEHVLQPDPLTIRMHNLIELQNWQVPGRQVSNPYTCSHLWRIAVPAGLGKGYHTALVEATDMHGVVHSEKVVFRVE